MICDTSFAIHDCMYPCLGSNAGVITKNTKLILKNYMNSTKNTKLITNNTKLIIVVYKRFLYITK